MKSHQTQHENSLATGNVDYQILLPRGEREVRDDVGICDFAQHP
jgi:hypothetical protein